MGHPYWRTSQPVSGSDTTVPSDSPLVNSAMARDRLATGTQRPTMLMDAGKTAASPRPNAMRAPMSAGSERNAAGGVSKVNSDHQNTATPSTIFPPYRLATVPLTTCSRIYPTKNDERTKPLVVSVHPN